MTTARFSSPAAVLLALGRSDDSRRPSLRSLLFAIALVAPVYGLALGCWDLSGERWRYALFAAIKLPLMILATGALCMPGFFVLTTVLGLRAQFARAAHAILASQAAVAFALASLAPVTLFIYVCGVSHAQALVAAGLMFLVATLAGQAVLWRHYRPLVAISRRHLLMLGYWLISYVFVGMQMGWMLRPFVGTPGTVPSFFREEPFSNAYVVIFRLVFGR